MQRWKDIRALLLWRKIQRQQKRLQDLKTEITILDQEIKWNMEKLKRLEHEEKQQNF
jgi:hypothetical protein